MDGQFPKWLMWDDETIKSYDKKENVYKYSYGISDINIASREFSPKSMYISKPFEINGNVMEVSLNTVEHHPIRRTLSDKINPYDTSIEYYITFKESIAENDGAAWIPILPKGQDEVDNELLIFEGNTAKLRFKRDMSRAISVYKNGILLDQQYWSYTQDNRIRIDKRFDKYDIYTVKYYPDTKLSSPWDIEIKDGDRIIRDFRRKITDSSGYEDHLDGELFEQGADRNGSILLSKTPYIDYGRLQTDSSYNPIEVYLISEKGLAGPNKSILNEVGPKTEGVKTLNVTDYINGESPILSPYDTKIGDEGVPVNPNFEYYQDGRRIYFTETFNNTHVFSNMQINHGDAKIKVRYKYLDTKARIKIILRNTSNRDKTISPVLHEYSLAFKVMR
jgi:hypothetical protein